MEGKGKERVGIMREGNGFREGREEGSIRIEGREGDR